MKLAVVTDRFGISAETYQEPSRLIRYSNPFDYGWENL